MADDAIDDIPDLPLFDTGEAVAPAEEPVVAEETPKEDGSDTEQKPESTEEPAKEEEKSEGETEPPAEEQKPETTDETDAEAQRRHNDAMAQQRIAERQRTRQAVEQQIDNAYAPKSQDELYQEAIDQGMDEQQANVQAQIQAMREEMQYSQQRSQIAELNAGMQAEAVNAMNDFPVFNEKSPEYDEEFTKEVEEDYKTYAKLQYDENGIILNAEVPLYAFYQKAWNTYNRGASKGATKAQAETTETLSRVESVAGGSSTTSRGAETLEEMGERLANMPLI